MNKPLSLEHEFPKGLLRAELFVGLLSSVSAQSVRFTLDSAGSPSGAHFLGGRYGRGEVGEFVLIEGQTTVLLGRIIEIHAPSADRPSTAVRPGDSGANAIGTIQLLGSVAMDNLRVMAGVESYPRLGDRVFAAPHNFIAALPTLMQIDSNTHKNITLNLGSIDSATETCVLITPEKLFGRHCAILGATGGGKSWTTARVIEECLRHRTKLILLDATGEYRELGGDAVLHFHLGHPVEVAFASQPCSLPPTCFIESDFIALFEPAGKVQGPKLRAAIRSLRLAKLAPGVATGGVVLKIDQPKAKVTAAELLEGVSDKLDDPTQEFDVAKLVRQLEQECVHPEGFGRGQGEKDPSKWGKESGEFSYCLSLVSRISSVLTCRSFDCVFKSSEPALTEAIAGFVKSDQRLMRICLSGISHEFRAREVTANAIGRHLLNLARTGSFQKSPLVVFVDEAHSFLGKKIGDEDSVAKLDAFELIAKEGRKYGLNICLSTQRPRDVTEDVLSQIGTLIVHRLTNDHDRAVVERACGEIDRSASSFLPNLRPGEAAVIGADFPIPLTIQISPPDAKPRSDGPDYQAHWA